MISSLEFIDGLNTQEKHEKHELEILDDLCNSDCRRYGRTIVWL